MNNLRASVKTSFAARSQNVGSTISFAADLGTGSACQHFFYLIQRADTGLFAVITHSVIFFLILGKFFHKI
jgi:hypothetical protein